MILWLHPISYILRLFTWTSPIRTLITVPFEAASASSSAFCFSFKSSCIGLISSDRSGGVYLLVPNLEKNHFLIYSLAARDSICIMYRLQPLFIYLPIEIGPPIIPYPISETKRVSNGPFWTASSIVECSRISDEHVLEVILLVIFASIPLLMKLLGPFPKISNNPSWIKTGLMVEVLEGLLVEFVMLLLWSWEVRFFRWRLRVEDLWTISNGQ